jgi:hypothetical protein
MFAFRAFRPFRFHRNPHFVVKISVSGSLIMSNDMVLYCFRAVRYTRYVRRVCHVRHVSQSNATRLFRNLLRYTRYIRTFLFE